MTESEADLGLASGSAGTAQANPRFYRKKPVKVEAVRLDDYNGGDVANWCGGALRGGPGGGSKGGSVIIPTLEGRMTASPGDWIIRGVKGEFYPCKPGIFAATYEPVESKYQIRERHKALRAQARADRRKNATADTQPLAAPKSSPSFAPVPSETEGQPE